MPYDPTLPANASPIVSAELRNQFAGLKDLIDDRPTSAEMTTYVLDNTSGKVDGVTELSTPISNPPTQAQVEEIRQKINEMLNALNQG